MDPDQSCQIDTSFPAWSTKAPFPALWQNPQVCDVENSSSARSCPPRMAGRAINKLPRICLSIVRREGRIAVSERCDWEGRSADFSPLRP